MHGDVECNDCGGGGGGMCVTGQGAQRVQPAPLVERRMRQILATVQKRCTTWVGSSVVHLGDRNVPNAL